MEQNKQEQDKAGVLSAVGKMAITLAAMVTLTLAIFFFNVPNPNIILISGLVVFTALYGYGAGLICMLVMIIYSMYFFSTDHSFFTYNDLNLQKMAAILLGVVVNTFFVGRLKKSRDAAVEELKEANRLLRYDNNMLEKATKTDTLTGIKNRFALQHDYPGYQGQNLCVMLLDVDDFKQVNDTYGHGMGDFVLTQVGKALKESFGAEHSYRYGGDEFLVIHNGMSEEAFAAEIDRFKSRLSKSWQPEQKIQFTVSAGYVFGYTELPTDLRIMMRHADNRLYEAKNLGKNQAVGAKFHRTFAEQLEQSSRWTG
jgi:diguanylate cyclase (GGDEF)-like protein